MKKLRYAAKTISTMIIIVALIIQVVFAQYMSGDTTLYIKRDEQTYRLRNTFSITNTGAYSAYNVTIKVRIGADSNSPYQTNGNYIIEPAARTIRRDPSGNIYGEIVLDELKAGDSKIITIDKYFLNSGISFSSGIAEMNNNYSIFRSNPLNAIYLQPGEKLESNSKEISGKLKDFNTKNGIVGLAKEIYSFVNTYIEYNTNSEYANKGALSALMKGKGVCDEYASLFTALCRAAGIPARVVTGYWVDEVLKPGVWKNVNSERHAWAEFYLEGAGWIIVEPTLQYTYNGIRLPNMDYFANMKPNDRHFVTGYIGGKYINEVSLYYSFYNDTSLSIKYGEEKLMLLDTYSNKSFFSDISGSWAKSYIDKLYSGGILFARKNTLFEPASNITRAEFAAFLVNALGLEAANNTIIFRDVSSEHKLIDFIKTANHYGIVNGDNLGNFRPEENISRQDAAVIMERALTLVNKAGRFETLDFTDKNKISLYAYDSVRLIYGMNIMSGKPGKLFDPKGFTTRAEAAKIIDNFINAIN